MGRRISAILGVVILVLVAAIVAVEAGAPFGGISRDDAIAAARQQIPSTSPASVSWALVAPLVLFRGGTSDEAAPPREIVWVVRLDGTYPPVSCGPPPPPGAQPHCPPDDHTATVVLDYMTGRFVMATIEP